MFVGGMNHNKSTSNCQIYDLEVKDLEEFPSVSQKVIDGYIIDKKIDEKEHFLLFSHDIF